MGKLIQVKVEAKVKVEVETRCLTLTSTLTSNRVKSVYLRVIRDKKSPPELREDF